MTAVPRGGIAIEPGPTDRAAGRLRPIDVRRGSRRPGVAPQSRSAGIGSGPAALPATSGAASCARGLRVRAR